MFRGQEANVEFSFGAPDIDDHQYRPGCNRPVAVLVAPTKGGDGGCLGVGERFGLGPFGALLIPS